MLPLLSPWPRPDQIILTDCELGLTLSTYLADPLGLAHARDHLHHLSRGHETSQENIK